MTLTLKDDSLTPLSSDEAPTVSMVDDLPSTTFEDISSTPPDGGGIILDGVRYTTHSDDICPELWYLFKGFMLNSHEGY